MSVLDIKQCTFRIVDGRKAELTIGTVNAAIKYTLKSKHRGTRQDVKVAHVTSGLSTPLSVVVTQSDDLYTITVNLATDGAGVATSTANAVKAAVDAAAPAAALVTTSIPGTGASVAVAAAAAAINTNPARSISFKVGEGTLSWGESKDYQYKLDAGNLDQVSEADEVPMTLDTGFTWEEFEAITGSGVPSLIDALNQINEASGWASTSDDPSGCSPYCVDIEVTRNPGSCGSEKKEVWTFEEFYWDDLNPTYKDGRVAFKGACNRIEPKLYRIA